MSSSSFPPKTKLLIGRRQLAEPIIVLIVWQETASIHILTRISERTDFRVKQYKWKIFSTSKAGWSDPLGAHLAYTCIPWFRHVCLYFLTELCNVILLLLPYLQNIYLAGSKCLPACLRKENLVMIYHIGTYLYLPLWSACVTSQYMSIKKHLRSPPTIFALAKS